ncbi:MAG: putative glycoside hydrolase [Candidatus Paceibacterota bacterium]
MSFKKNTTRFILISLAFVVCVVVVYYVLPAFSSMVRGNSIEYSAVQDLLKDKENKSKEKEKIIPVTHIKTPENVKALYMSSWVAGSDNFRNSLVKIVDETELNAVVIDIKDSTGRISFNIDDTLIKEIGSSENRIKNIRAFTSLLHSKNIYIIGRISVFQDPYLTKLKPEWAIKKSSDGEVWKDKKGLSFLDPTNKNVHEYILSIALNSYKEGFDEINFDYIRYPSDGNMKDINYNLTDGKTRADNIEEFFKYISTEIKKNENITISADLFGLTTEATDDMGIGQVWEKTIPYFDFVCPMVYPSHYPSSYAGYKNPALYPYEVINRALISAIIKTKNIDQNITKIRPWLQDFDLGAVYTKEMIQAQIKAVYDNSLNSWMLWDPANKYTSSALELVTH